MFWQLATLQTQSIDVDEVFMIKSLVKTDILELLKKLLACMSSCEGIFTCAELVGSRNWYNFILFGGSRVNLTELIGSTPSLLVRKCFLKKRYEEAKRKKKNYVSVLSVGYSIAVEFSCRQSPANRGHKHSQTYSFESIATVNAVLCAYFFPFIYLKGRFFFFFDCLSKYWNHGRSNKLYILRGNVYSCKMQLLRW